MPIMATTATSDVGPEVTDERGQIPVCRLTGEVPAHRGLSALVRTIHAQHTDAHDRCYPSRTEHLRPMSLWRKHPGVRTGDALTTGERAAGFVRNGMGSWPFVFLFLAVMALWAAYNTSDGFDPYPFILLNLFLSMIAGLQGAILLISAKRADSVSSEVAVHTLSNTALLQEMIEANTVLTESVARLASEIHEHVCPSAVRSR